MTNNEVVYTQLSEWLNHRKPDYNTGMALLLSYTDKPALYNQLTIHKDPKQLRKVLMLLLEKVKAKMPVESAEEKPEPVLIREVATAAPAAPAPRTSVEKELHEEWVGYLKQIADLKQKLYYIGRDAATDKRQTKTLMDARKEILTGHPFDMSFCTFDEKRGTGGELVEVKGCRIMRSEQEKREISSPMPSMTDYISGKNPRHLLHNTVNILLKNGDTQKVHWLLIEQFAHYKIIF